MARTETRASGSPAPPSGESGGVYFGYYNVGAALIAQLIAVGAQASVSGVFLDPMTEALGWTKTEFTLAQTINRG